MSGKESKKPLDPNAQEFIPKKLGQFRESKYVVPGSSGWPSNSKHKLPFQTKSVKQKSQRPPSSSQTLFNPENKNRRNTYENKEAPPVLLNVSSDGNCKKQHRDWYPPKNKW